MKIEYIEYGLDTVLKVFADGLESKDGKISLVEPFVDTAKKKVIFKVYVTEAKTPNLKDS